MYHQVKTSPVICDNNANFCQGAPGDSVKIQSRSGLSILFTTMPGLTPSAYWCFDFSCIFFFPEKSHRLVESKTVKGMFATRLRNTCPPSLPIAHQTHTQACRWIQARLVFRTPKQHLPQKKNKPSHSRFSPRHSQSHSENRHHFAFHVPVPDHYFTTL